MALFRCASGSSGGGATITVTYSSDFYGETVTCSHGTKTYSKVATSSGTLEFSVDEEGTWTISSMGFSDTADVVLNYPAELVSLPNGETVLPTDDIETWLACAAITDKAYTTLSQVLGDSETYNALLGDSNACAYMKRSTTWSTDICADQYSMNLLGQYDTACDALLSDSTWASAIANSTYFESVLNVKVPVMTSATTPSGTVDASREWASDYSKWKAFNPSQTNGWLAYNTNPYIDADDWVSYEFASNVAVSLAKATLVYQHSATTVSGKIQGYNGSSWVDVSSVVQITSNSSNIPTDIVTIPAGADEKYRWVCTTAPSSNYHLGLKLQFYGRTTSSEKIHGGNPTYDSFYRIVDGNNVPVTDPSLLDAGTYTIYSNGLAKDPDDLSADYGKTVRICPNTKEIVVRPDNALYWWGYENPNLEDCDSSHGWTIPSGYSFVSPTRDTKYILFNSTQGKVSFVGDKYSSTDDFYGITEGVTAQNGVYGFANVIVNKDYNTSAGSGTISTSQLAKISINNTGTGHPNIGTSNAKSLKVYALVRE